MDPARPATHSLMPDMRQSSNPDTPHLAGLECGAPTADYGDVDAEAHACRSGCALFDFSFLAIAELRGAGARETILAFTGRDFSRLPPGRIGYALRADDEGYLRSDLTVWNMGGDRWLVMSGTHRDVEALGQTRRAGLVLRDLSLETAVLAVQGPDALASLAGVADTAPIVRIPYFGHTRARVAGHPCLVGRLGYTGEKGFELLFPSEHYAAIRTKLAERARPAGFAAADRLRIEAGFVLFTNEFRVPVTAREVGMERFAPAPTSAPRATLVCFRAETDAPPVLWQPGPDVALPGEPGTITVTSAAPSAIAGGTLGLGYVLPGDARADASVIDPRGEFHAIRLVSLPYYDPAKARPRGP